LVINDTATAGLDQRKLKAIKDWVAKGGTLVLSGGAGYGKTAEAFADITPVIAGGTMELSDVSIIERAGGADHKLSGTLSIATGTVAAGTVELAQDGVPLAVNRKLGFGTVSFIAF